MDVEQERHAGGLDFLRVGDDVVFVGIGFGLVTAARRGIAVLRLGIHEGLEADGVEAVVFQQGEDVLLGSVHVVELGLVTFVFLHGRDVGTSIELEFNGCVGRRRRRRLRGLYGRR